MSDKRMISAQFDAAVARRLRVAAAERDVSQSELVRAGAQLLLDDSDAMDKALSASAAKAS